MIARNEVVIKCCFDRGADNDATRVVARDYGFWRSRPLWRPAGGRGSRSSGGGRAGGGGRASARSRV